MRSLPLVALAVAALLGLNSAAAALPLPHSDGLPRPIGDSMPIFEYWIKNADQQTLCTSHDDRLLVWMAPLSVVREPAESSYDVHLEPSTNEPSCGTIDLFFTTFDIDLLSPSGQVEGHVAGECFAGTATAFSGYDDDRQIDLDLYVQDGCLPGLVGIIHVAIRATDIHPQTALVCTPLDSGGLVPCVGVAEHRGDDCDGRAGETRAIALIGGRSCLYGSEYTYVATILVGINSRDGACRFYLNAVVDFVYGDCPAAVGDATGIPPWGYLIP